MRAAVAAILLFASACATRTNTMMIDDSTAVISGRNYGYTDHAGVMRKILQTAAEIGAARGFASFDIVNTVDASTSGTVLLPGQSTTNTTASTYCSGAWCSGNANSATQTMPARAVGYYEPGADVTVRFYRADEGSYRIASILSSPK